MQFLQKSTVALLLAGVALMSTGVAMAEEPWHEGNAWRYEQHPWHPEQHPYYMHAMTDLRLARDLLARPDLPRVVQDEHHAVEEINQALHIMQDAAIDDGKNPFVRMPPDADSHGEDRFHHSLRLLDKARQDASQREDDPYLRDLQQRIILHIGEAEHAVQAAISEALR